MKKKYVVAGMTCVFIVVTGVFYSCSYSSNPPALVTSLSEDSQPENLQKGENTSTQEAKLAEDGNSAMTPLQKDETLSSTPETAVLTESNSTTEINVIYVHMCGAVNNPGVYKAESGSRLCDFIQLAGGLQKNAASDYVNQARQVVDGERIYIPTGEELKELTMEEMISGDQTKPGTSQTKDSASVDEKSSEPVNINTAGLEELMNLPGIGQAKANSILAYRTDHGSFQTIEELMNIPGIKEGLFNQISAYVDVK